MKLSDAITLAKARGIDRTAMVLGYRWAHGLESEGTLLQSLTEIRDIGHSMTHKVRHVYDLIPIMEARDVVNQLEADFLRRAVQQPGSVHQSVST